jgi:hypothetical protein
VVAADLRGACGNQLHEFRHRYPDGATWPDDVPEAAIAGLDVRWAEGNLGLLPLLEVPGE